MKWTDKLPTEPGWYWWIQKRLAHRGQFSIVEIYDDDDRLRLSFSGMVDYDANPPLKGYEDDDRLWSGPIEPPEEASDE